MSRGFTSVRNERSERGNMLSMTALIGGIILLTCIIAFCFYMLLAEQNRGQSKVDKSTLELAKAFNEGDRVGQLNNVVARNRELVFVSRQSVDQASAKGLTVWSALANSLCDNERKLQIKLSLKEARDFAYQHNLKTDSQNAVFSLPWWRTYDTQIYEVSVGSVKGVESNVLNTDVYPDLRQYDEEKRYFQKGSNLYLGGINAKLPSPDNDLDFHFAALPAPVDNTISPARLVNAEAFRTAATIFQDDKNLDHTPPDLPTAVQIIEKMPVSAMDTRNRDDVRIGSVAASTGAVPPPE
jgi:hypothetical protein